MLGPTSKSLDRGSTMMPELRLLRTLAHSIRRKTRALQPLKQRVLPEE